MKYIRLKNKIVKIEDEDSECYYFNKLKKFVYKDEGYQIADTIEELCDEVVCEQTHTLMRPYFKKHDDEGFPDETYHEGIVNAIRKGHFNAKNFDWFGAIWTTGDNGEPILKSVTKLKGILPNGEIDWELI